MTNPGNAAIEADLSLRTPAALGRHLRDAQLSPRQLAAQLEQADGQSDTSVYTFARAVISTQQSRDQFVAEGDELFKMTTQLSSPARRDVMRAVVDETGHAGGLYLIQNLSMLKKGDAREGMKDYLAAGGSVADVSEWLQLAGQVLRQHNVKPSDTAGLKKGSPTRQPVLSCQNT